MSTQYVGVIFGLYGDNGNGNGSYYIRFKGIYVYM